MKNHQRYFATTKSDGMLAGRFVVVANTVARDGGKAIVDGNERVLRARLSDAKFFWDQDRKLRLAERLPALKDIVFHAKLGTQAERIERIARLALRRSPNTCRARNAAQVEEAALLCKADLVTGMVGEFPELQGIMGRYYALSEELPAPVADAIGDHYAPAGPNDRCPSAPVSIAVALADKLDALIALLVDRREADGLARSLCAAARCAGRHPHRGREQACRAAAVTQFLRRSAERLCMAFFAERLKVQMREKGVRHDVVDAVFALGGEDDLVRLLARVEAVQSFLGSEAGRNLLTAYGRAANIVRAEEKKDKALAAKIAGAPDAALLEQSEEKAVASALAASRDARWRRRSRRRISPAR